MGKKTKAKVVAKHRSRGTEYVFCEKTPYGNFYMVNTGKSLSSWVVDGREVILLAPTSFYGSGS